MGHKRATAAVGTWNRPGGLSEHTDMVRGKLYKMNKDNQ